MTRLAVLIVAGLLLAPEAMAQPSDALDADRPPPRPEAEVIAPTAPIPSPSAAARPPEAPDSPEPDAGDEDALTEGVQSNSRSPELAPPSGPPKREVLRESDHDFSACLLALRLMGADYEAVPEITGEQRDCGIARPVKLAESLPGLLLEGAPLMRCETARALGWWLRDHMLPAAARLPGSPHPASLVLGSTYDCRGVVGNGGEAAKLSEHAFGNALDIAAVRLDDGGTVEIAQAGGNDMAAAMIAAIRGAACLYFTTVLGPGANAAHGDHLHLDIKAREGGYRICE